MRDERRDEIGKNIYITRDEIDKKEQNISLSLKELRSAASKSSYTLIKFKKLTFFTSKGSLLRRKDI